MLRNSKFSCLSLYHYSSCSRIIPVISTKLCPSPSKSSSSWLSYLSFKGCLLTLAPLYEDWDTFGIFTLAIIGHFSSSSSMGTLANLYRLVIVPLFIKPPVHFPAMASKTDSCIILSLLNFSPLWIA